MSDIEKVGPNISGESLNKEEIKANYDELLNSKYSSLAEFIGENSLLIIVNDFKRATPTALFLETLDEYLDENDIDLFDRDLSIIVATGTHDPPSEEGLKHILGKYYDRLKSKTIIHRCKENEHIKIGKTSRETPVKIDKNILGYDRIININSVEPHYFAGFTGGRKSLLPGICHWDTIVANHEYSLDEEARPLSLKENPMNLDAMEAAEMIIDYLDSKILSINSVSTSEKVYKVSAGDFFDTFESLIDRSKEIFTTEVSKKADIVIARTAAPGTKNLYQSFKSFENCKHICKDGGVLIMVSECYEGIGPRTFYDLLSSSDNPDEIVEQVYDDYPFGGHKATNILEFLEDHSLTIVSGLEDEIIENCFCEPCKSVEKALESAVEKLNIDNPHIVDVEEANNVVPIVR
ncbi:MAG: nickel-dependent lactate racemase [Thermoplasmatota archaeon]